MNKSLSNFLVGFLAGAAAGAIAGILFAPGKGSETRQNIRKKVKEFSDEFGLGINEFIEDMGLVTEPVAAATTKKPAGKPKKKPGGQRKMKITKD
jgi:gas vesicle protein